MTAPFSNILRASNEFFVAPLSIYGTLTRRPCANIEIAEQVWERYLEDDTAVSDVLYTTAHKAFVLQALPTLNDMDLTNVVVATGDVSLCYPSSGLSDTPGHVPAYLYMYNATGNHAVSWETTTLLPEAPGILLSFVRSQMLPPDQTDDVTFTFTFGGGWRIEWGLLREIRVYDPDGWLALKQRISLSESAAFYGNAHLVWEVHNIGGNLYIECSALDQPLTIHEYKDPAYREDPSVDSRTVGVLPSAPVAWSSTGGVHAVLVDYFRYPTTGYVETDWLEHMGVYTTDPIAFVYPTPPSGTSVNVTVIASSGTKRRYRITLNGDGMHTPFVQMVQLFYSAIYAAASGEWTDVSDSIQNVKETIPEDIGKRTTEMTLDNWEGDALGFSGQMAFRYSLGHALRDSSTDSVNRFCGLLKIHRYTHSRGERSYKATGDDRAALLAETELLNPPCLTGFYVDDAIAVLATYGGVASWDIVVESGTYKQLNLPKYGYDNPPWMPRTGQKCWALIQELCDAYNVRAEFWPDGKLHIMPDIDGVLFGAYSAVEGTSREGATSSVEAVSDLTGVTNCILVQGRGEDGKPLYAVRYDSDSIYDNTSTRFMGAVLMHYAADANLSSQQEVNYACVSQYKKRKSGGLLLTLKGPFVGWNVFPGALITVEAPKAGIVTPLLCRVITVMVEPNKDGFNPGQIVCTEVTDY